MADCSCNDPVVLLPTPPSPLYAFEVSPQSGPGCVFTIPPTTVFIFPFWLCPSKTIEINAVLTAAHQQDNSLKVWVARAPLGNPVIDKPAYLNSWETVRSLGKQVTLFDRDQPPAQLPLLAAGLVPGPYLLHVLNLTNSVNEFSLRLEQTGGNGEP
jgi:hypothetical protein